LEKEGLGKTSARKIIIGATLISRPPPPAARQVCSTLPRPSASGKGGQGRRKPQRVCDRLGRFRVDVATVVLSILSQPLLAAFLQIPYFASTWSSHARLRVATQGSQVGL
jgi:hypothetical protein